MNPIAILTLLFGGWMLYNHQKAQDAASEKKIDDQASSNPDVKDVYALKEAINPSTVSWLVKFDDADTKTIHDILRKHNGENFNAFNQMFSDKYHTSIIDLINQKLILSQANKDWVMSIIENRETVAQQQGDFPQVRPDMSSKSDTRAGRHIKFYVPNQGYPSIDSTLDYRQQKPNLNSPSFAFAAGDVSDYADTGVVYIDSNFWHGDVVYLLLGDDTLDNFYWVMSATKSGSLIGYAEN